jgi:hypothetical protein
LWLLERRWRLARHLLVGWPLMSTSSRSSRGLCLAALVVVALPLRGAAQDVTPIILPPPNIIVPNYNGVPTGPLGGLEGSAYVARAADTSAPWLNPAGLSQAGTQLSGSVSTYMLTTITPRFLPGNGGSTQHLPNLVGATGRFKGFAVGFSIVTTASWNEGWNAVRLTNADASPERFAYTSNASFTQRVTVGGVGHNIGRKWRVGGALALEGTSMHSTQIISDRVNDPTGLRTLLFTSDAGGSIDHARLIFGTQYDPIPAVRLGFTVRTPGLSYGHSGSTKLDATLTGDNYTLGATAFDTGAQFDYKLPVETVVAAAFVSTRTEIEADVKSYSSIDPYTVLSSGQPLTIYTDYADGSAGTIDNRTLPALTSSSNSVTNVTVGGHVVVWPSWAMKLHAGVGTDFSPVPAGDHVAFDKVDFWVFTAGASGAIGKLTFALGLNYRRGNSDNLILRNLIIQPIYTHLDIKTVGLTYAINYRF